MEINERRANKDRRSAAGFNSAAPFLTRDGLVFTDRRRGDRDRRQVDMTEVFELGEVEEIVLEPVRFS